MGMGTWGYHNRAMRLTFLTLLVLIGYASLVPLEGGRRKGNRGKPRTGAAEVKDAAAVTDDAAADTGDAAAEDAGDGAAADAGDGAEPAEGAETAEGDDAGAAEEGADDGAGDDPAATEDDGAAAEADTGADTAEPAGDDGAADDGTADDAGGPEAADAPAAEGELSFQVSDSDSGKAMAEKVINRLKELNAWLEGVVTYWDNKAVMPEQVPRMLGLMVT